MLFRSRPAPDAPQERSNFFYALSLLPKEKREAMRRIYDFCRATDDIADDESAPIEIRKVRLRRWREDVLRCYDGIPASPQLLLLAPVLKHYKIPKEYLLDLIDGVETDLVMSRFEAFEELKKYCYRVASAVGLISLQVFGYRLESTKDYAINLGYALQLTNILRDVKQDAANGRIYIPLEDLRRFGCTEQEILSGDNTQNFEALMQFEAKRAKEYYEYANASLQREDRRAMFAARTMSAIYFRLLLKIERDGFDVFSKRIAVSNSFKIFTALRFWLGSRFALFA